jgi:hypothetical protein
VLSNRTVHAEILFTNFIRLDFTEELWREIDIAFLRSGWSIARRRAPTLLNDIHHAIPSVASGDMSMLVHAGLDENERKNRAD